MSLSVAVAMTTTIGVEYGFGRLTHASDRGLLVAILLGTVMAMMGSMALGGTQSWLKVRTAVFFPVAIAVGMLPGTVVVGHTDLMLAGHVFGSVHSPVRHGVFLLRLHDLDGVLLRGIPRRSTVGPAVSNRQQQLR
ncbi:hypothetical protein [Nocardia sp. NPDC051570]|uniref:hypothetical protein n=1 Tax=Nocardia sp. NPDC051570 TaxID=3364324 RepID=UPI0037A43016